MMETAMMNKQDSSKISKNLNNDNYYSNETDWKYQSKSWFWKFEQCEAKALAELKGEYKEDQSQTPLLVGNYLHSYFESEEAHQQFLDEHPKELYKYGNPEKGIKADFLVADNMIEALSYDPKFKEIYQGEKEVVVTGKLFGVDWKGKIDCLNLDRGYFLDLKTVDDIHKKHWSNELRSYVNFAQARGYDMQMAIYKELIKQTFGVECQPLIIAVSKQDEPDKGVYSIPDNLMDFQLQVIEKKQPHIQAVIEGRERPTYCGHCKYCRSKKYLGDIINIDEIDFC